MPIAVFQNKNFQVSSNGIYTINGLTWGGDIQLEAQDKLNSKPSTYIKGMNLNNMSFEIPLKSSLGVNVRNEIEEWESIRDKVSPSIFILGTKPLGPNKWLLKSTNASNTIIDNKGTITEATLKLEFEEFVRPGSAENSSSSGSSSKATAVNVGITPSDYIYNTPTKTEQKRNNINVDAATGLGYKVVRGGKMLE